MSTIEAPREQEQVIGVVTGIITKAADKWQVAVLPDSSTQYTKNLWTKDAALVQSLSTMIGQRLAFLCNVSHWSMQDGTPVRSLWIETTGQAAPGSPAMAGPPQQAPIPATNMQAPIVVQPQAIPMQAPVQQHVSQDVKEQRIHRQTASKVAAIMLSHVEEKERTMSTLFVLAERLVAYYNEGMPHAENLDQLMQRAMPQGMEQAPAQPEPWNDPDDTSIPF